MRIPCSIITAVPHSHRYGYYLFSIITHRACQNANCVSCGTGILDSAADFDLLGIDAVCSTLLHCVKEEEKQFQTFSIHVNTGCNSVAPLLCCLRYCYHLGSPCLLVEQPLQDRSSKDKHLREGDQPKVLRSLPC